MNLIGTLNILSVLLLLLSVVILIYKYFRTFRRDSSLIFLIFPFLISIFVTFTNILEHFNISAFLDEFEDEIEILFIPLFIFAVLSYNLRKELKINSQTRKHLAESNLRLNMSLEGAKEGLWEYVPVSKSLNIITDFFFLGFEPEFFLITPDNWRQIIHPDSHGKFLQLLEVFDHGSNLPADSEIRIKTAEGDYRWVLFKGKKCDDQTFMGTIFDISNFIKTQEELTEARLKAEESDQLKTAFLANLSHEIRTPMNGIMGFSDLLKDPALTPEKRLDFIQNIRVSGQRLLSIINDIIEASHIDSHQIKVHNSPVEIGKLVLEVYKEMQMLIPRNKDVKIILDTPSALPLLILTDPVKLQQILANLVNNAIKYTLHGQIRMGFTVNKTAEVIEFYVSDTGIGIDKKFHHLIFERFRQLNMNYTNLAGLGLGLSISKAYVKLLGGDIRLESEIDKGSSFYFTIPLIPAAPGSVHTGEVRTGNRNIIKDMVILIAEDDDSNFTYIREMLSPFQCKLLRVVNGIEAIEACKENAEISLVLMDIKMPLLNGLDATREIKRIRKELPVIAQTAYAFPADEQKARKAGCDGYVSKPVIREKLFQEIEKVIKKQ